ncbi:hypothetical protein KIPB_004942, partial [Kipferlia bialata]
WIMERKKNFPSAARQRQRQQEREAKASSGALSRDPSAAKGHIACETAVVAEEPRVRPNKAGGPGEKRKGKGKRRGPPLNVVKETPPLYERLIHRQHMAQRSMLLSALLYTQQHGWLQGEREDSESESESGSGSESSDDSSSDSSSYSYESETEEEEEHDAGDAETEGKVPNSIPETPEPVQAELDIIDTESLPNSDSGGHQPPNQ